MPDPWSLDLEPGVLLPGRRAHATVAFLPDRDFDARRVRARLRCVERWRYDATEQTVAAGGGMQSHRVTRTGQDQVHQVEWTLAGPTSFRAGKRIAWEFEIEVPGLGPASFEGEELRCDWTLEATVDRPMAPDETSTWHVHVAQPVALLRAGVVATGMYGLFEEAPANVGALPAQIRLEPVPLNLWAPFSGWFTVETSEPIQLQEVRLELRVAVEVTVRGGRTEEIRVGSGRLEHGPVAFGGPLSSHPFKGDAPQAWLPSIDLPHGRARASFHVILAQAWARDTHYVRDIAVATTDVL
jgi:Arrestin (or S-antigen), N-terminal domain